MSNSDALPKSDDQEQPSHPVHMDDSVNLRHYQMGKSLGEGGFGQVRQAWDSKLQRYVAIKQLKSLDGHSSTASLIKEARLAASLQHPAFVKVFAIEDEFDPPAIIMELVPGQTLKQRLQQGPLETTQALDVVLQVAQAMQVAHVSGLTHGDLKPSNLMLEPDSRVRILDFGLASHADTQLTTSLNQLDPQGTIAYMAPERMTGSAATPQSDIYALGVILYESVCGKRPFANLNGLALAAALMQANSDSWEFPSLTPPAVIQLMIAMTTRQAERRLPDMQQVITQIQQAHNTDSSGTVSMKAEAMTLPQHAPAKLFPSASGWQRSKPARILMAISASVLLAFGAWKAIPYLNFDTSLLKPYSEALTMQQGLDALTLFDRPGSLDKAQQSFETILKHSPNNAAAVAGVSLVYSYRYGNEFKDETLLRQADASAQQALKLNPLLALTHTAQAKVLYAQGKTEQALLEYDQALSLDAENIFACFGKINVLTTLRKYREAQAYAQTQLNQHPTERHFADLLGYAFFQEGKFDEAEQAFRHSIKIQPDAVFAYASLAAILARKKDSNAAMQILQQGLQIRPSSLLYSNLGNILFMRGDYPAAVDAFENAVSPVKGNPADYLDWANLGDALLWMPGRKQEAKHAYEKAIDLLMPQLLRAPDNPTINSQMGLYAARAGNEKESQQYTEKALQLLPENATVHFRAGLAYELLNNRVRALEEIHLAMKKGYPRKFIEAEPDLLALRKDARYEQ